MSFAKNTGKHIGKSVSKKLSGTYNQKILNHAKKSTASKKIKIKNKKIKRKFKKQQKQLVIRLVIQSPVKLQIIYSRIIQIMIHK